MAGSTKVYTPSAVHQGPYDLWVIVTAVPDDTAQRLTMDAATGTPDGTTHANSVHLGLTMGDVTIKVASKLADIKGDQFAAALDQFVTEEEATLEFEMSELEMQKLQRAMGVATYATAAGYKQMTFGGSNVPPKVCIAAISPKRADSTKQYVALLYSAIAQANVSVALGRSKQSGYKVSFKALADPARTAGRQVCNIYETIA